MLSASDIDSQAHTRQNIIIRSPSLYRFFSVTHYISVSCGGEVSLGDVCHKGYSIGSLAEGLDIKNAQLYKLDHAPLCRNCDAYQCKRCIHFSEVKTKFALAEQSLKAYLENDNKYLSHANEMLYAITSFHSEERTNKESMDLTIADFERRCSEYEQKQREAYKRELEQQRLNIERQKLYEQSL